MKFESLSAPVRSADVATYYREQSIPRRQRAWLGAVQLAVMFAVAAAIGIYLVVTIAPAGLPLPLVVAAIVVVAIGWLCWTILRGRRYLTRAVLISRFARANGLGFTASIQNPAFRGSAFTEGKSRTATNVISAPGDTVPFTVGTHQSAIESTTGMNVVRFDFVELVLERALPHIVLANSSAKVLKATDQAFARGQRLSLEGNFDRTFSLYCPKDYERDALYVFTPDLMVQLLDFAPDCELEIIDNKAYLYSVERDLWQREEFEKLYAVIGRLGKTLRRRSESYADEQVAGSRSALWNEGGIGRVASGGRRLQSGIGARGIFSIVVAAVVVIAAVWYFAANPEALTHLRIHL